MTRLFMPRVLIIDDFFEFAAWLENILSHSGYECDVCTSGNLAKQKIASETYDLIITDIIMPEPDGIELCKFIRENMDEEKSKTPIVAISGGAATIDARVALSAVGQHANLVMQKPFSPESLLKAVRHVLRDGDRSYSA
jgi:DNA-binding response OmpR family regulator